MNLTVDIQRVCEDDDQPPPPKIRQWVEAALTHCALNNSPASRPPNDANAASVSAELTVRIVDEREIRELNLSYRGMDKPTNVLSFPADLPDHIDLPLLGDVVICAAVVKREAEQQHKVAEHHWAHMVIHGCLHLLGYDHIDDDDAATMEALEVAILEDLNIPDPYLISAADSQCPHTISNDKAVNL